MNLKIKLTLAFLFTFIVMAFLFIFLKPSHQPSIPNILVNTPEKNNFNFQRITPIPQTLSISKTKAKLGKKLFFDVRLSANNQVACASCHNLNKAGTDGLPIAKGINHKIGLVNTPTVFNAVFNFVQDWNGRAESLAEQAKGPLFTSFEMGNKTPDKLLALFKNDPTYINLFKQAFPKQTPSIELATQALQAYQSTLITPNSRFDQYLKGDQKALSKLELKGYQLFQNLGCISCHNGINIGGNMYQTAGIFAPLTPNTPTQKNWPDRYDVTGLESDHHKVKVPSLRNIVATAPYLHDGSIATLSKLIKTMGHSQLGKTLTDSQVTALKAFLTTLTGQYQGHYLDKRH